MKKIPEDLIEGAEYVVRYELNPDPRRAPRYVEKVLRFERKLPGFELAYFRGPRGARVAILAKEIESVAVFDLSRD